MNKTLKFVITISVFLILFYFAYIIYNVNRYRHAIDWHIYKQYTWFLKDSVKNKLDTNFCYSYVNKRDVYNNYDYNHTYNIIIWEFKDFGAFDLSKIKFYQNCTFDNKKIRSGETLNKNSDIEIKIKFGFISNSIQNVNLDNNSKIINSITSANYLGFYGIINKMSFSNEKEESQILFDYTNGREPSLFLVYKGRNSFYVILINSKKEFDESIINILNLK